VNNIDISVPRLTNQYVGYENVWKFVITRNFR
jgi:hypothetical protein